MDELSAPRYIVPMIVSRNIAMNNNFEHCHMYTTQFCQESKVRFIYTSTTTRSHSCSEKTTRTPRVHLVCIIAKSKVVPYKTFTQNIPLVGSGINECHRDI